MSRNKNNVGSKSGNGNGDESGATIGDGFGTGRNSEGNGEAGSGDGTFSAGSAGSGDESGNSGNQSGDGATNFVGDDGSGGVATVGSVEPSGTDNGSDSGRRRRGRPRKLDASGSGSDSGKSGDGSGDARNASAETQKPSQTASDVKTPKTGFSDFFNETFESPKSKKKSSALFEREETIQLVAWVFLLAATFFGEHWKLKQSEATLLGEKVHAVLEQFPVTVAKKYQKELEKYAPFVSLAFTGAVIVVPRIKTTMQLQENEQLNELKSVRAGDGNEQRTNANVNSASNAQPNTQGIPNPFSGNGANSVFKPASVA